MTPLRHLMNKVHYTVVIFDNFCPKMAVLTEAQKCLILKAFIIASIICSKSKIASDSGNIENWIFWRNLPNIATVLELKNADASRCRLGNYNPVKKRFSSFCGFKYWNESNANGNWNKESLLIRDHDLISKVDLVS